MKSDKPNRWETAYLIIEAIYEIVVCVFLSVLSAAILVLLVKLVGLA